MKQLLEKLHLRLWHLLLLLGFFMISPLEASAGTPDIQGTLGKTAQQPFGADPSGIADRTPGQLVGSIVQVALGFVGTIAFIVFLYGGFLWLTARGNEEQVGRAKKYLTNGAIGTIVIVLAYAATYYITEQLYYAAT